MYVYQTDDGFRSLDLIPQDYFKFWTGETEPTDLGNYLKPTGSIPIVNWELDYHADDWRRIIVNADTSRLIDLPALRRIPDSYIEAIFQNVLYGRSMRYRGARAQYLPLRIGDSFTKDFMAYPGLALVLLGLKGLIVQEQGKQTNAAYVRADILRVMNQHVTYVASRIVKSGTTIKRSERILVGVVTAERSDLVFYDTLSMQDFIDEGGSLDLVAANWAINRTLPDDSTIANQDTIMARWKTITALDTAETSL